MAHYATERAESAAQVVANPAPLGLSAFALTTFVLSCSNAGFIFPVGGGLDIVIGLAIFYGGIVQLIAGVQEFKAGNTFGATAFCSYGGFWLALGFALLPPAGIQAALIKAATLNTALGVFLLGWTIFTLVMFLGTFRISLALMGVFFFLLLAFLTLTISFLGGGIAWLVIGGWLGIITALLAWYTALSGILAATNAQFQLPVFPRS
jgi:succinate-acetate transporter protein